MSTTATLAIAGGTPMAASDRGATRLRLDRYKWSLDSPRELAFSMFGQKLPNTYLPGSSAVFVLNGTTVFTGDIVSIGKAFSKDLGWGDGYRCLGLEYRAQNIPFTGIDFTGLQSWNLPTDDSYYSISQAGQSVGQILSAILTNHATALTAIGITSYTAGDFSGGYMDVVPPERVDVGGERLWNALTGFLGKWARNHALYVSPVGNVRCLNTRGLSPITLTMGSDPIEPPALSRDTTDSWTRVRIRGKGDIQPAILSLANGTLTEAFTNTDKTNWKWASYARPGNASDTGTCTVVDSTHVTVTSSDAAVNWGINYLSGINAWLNVINTTALGTINAHEMYPVTANSPMTAGGSSTITLANPLSVGGYNKYELIGQAPDISKTWRLYNIAATYVSQHLVTRFPKPVPFANNGTVVGTLYPTCAIYWSSTGLPPYITIFAPFDLLISTGQIRFTVPVVKAFATQQSDLDTGGFTTRTATNGVPADIKVMLPYSRGALTLQRPSPTTYAGTAYTIDGISREKVIDLESWKWAFDGSTNVQPLADMYLDSVKDTLVEGSVVYHGYLASCLEPGNCLNVAGTMGATPYTTGWMATMAAPVRSYELSWAQGNETEIITTLGVSTRRQVATGDSLYSHPAFGAIAMLDSQLNGGSVAIPFQADTSSQTGQSVGGIVPGTEPIGGK